MTAFGNGTTSPTPLRELSQGSLKCNSPAQTAGELSHKLSVSYCRPHRLLPLRQQPAVWVRIVNQFNDNYDYFYVKRPISGCNGLELEHILSPNSINSCSTARHA
jgi:hypothetical protein